MKRVIIILICAFSGCMSLFAQDLIVKTDNVEIKAKVTEVSSQEIRYKRFSNIDGPIYVLPVVELKYIQYQNGERDIFNESPTAAVVAESAVVASELTTQPIVEHSKLSTTESVPLDPSGASQRVVAGAKYEIGDYYSANGVEGVVCVLDEDKLHGLIISLEEMYLPWAIFRKDKLVVVGASDKSDGVSNMKIIEEYIANNNLSWSDFPAFNWAKELGAGWYIPSIDELLQIGSNYNGGNRMSIDKSVRSDFNDRLKKNGGERMDRMMYYFSSTERDEKYAFCSQMSIDPPYVVDIPKYSKFLVRAVHKF